MITLTIAATLAALVPLIWLLLETSRSRWLAFAIPALVAAPIGFYAYGTSLLGYATPSGLPKEWSLVHAAVDDEARTVWLLARVPGAAPRLYAVTENFEEARKKAGQAQAALDKGMPVRGRASGVGNGEFVFYVLPPMAGSKEG